MHRVQAVRIEGGQLLHATWWELYHAVYSEVPVELTELTIPQLQSHLRRRWDDRKHMSSQQAEELVAALLQEHYQGEVLRVTANANSKDGGIDLYVIHDNGAVKRAVQVKRRQTRDTESVQEIRNFVGAMILDGAELGVFVTTASRFTAPAAAIPANEGLTRKKLTLELIDGQKLYELLEHSNRKQPLILPDDITPNQEWVGPNGRIFRTEELFFGDLRRFE